MGVQIEGAIDNITEPQLAFIRDVLEKRGFKNTVATIQVVGEASDNYVANVKRIVVSDDAGEFRMIAKISPQNEMIRAVMDTEKLFRNEHIMYTVVLPKFQQIQKHADIPKEDRFRFAECYGSLSDPPHEVILLEDLVVPGFAMLNRFKPLSEECIRSVLKNFARLHSLSYALKHKEPETFNSYKNNLFDMWGNMDNKPDIQMHFKHLETTATMTVAEDERKKVLNGSIFEAVAQCAKLAKEDAGSRFSVIQQGDSWTNNILFRLEGDSLQDSILIDYQISKENNPTCDLMYMIFNCTDHISRKDRFNDWIDYYHFELEKALSRHSLQVNFVYPRDQLDADLRRYAKVMFGISVILANGLILKPEQAAKMKETLENTNDEKIIAEVGKLDEESTLLYKARLEGLVDTVIELGLF